ncbi:unnamed protein product [Aphanomyces euteiches]
MEYAYQDWCIGTLANELGNQQLAEAYWQSSKKIWNLWREDIGFFAPKHANGGWVEPFNPAKCLPDSWNDPYFYEGTSWQWSFNVQHDFAGLISRHGGKPAFINHLDQFFNQGHFYPKETMLHVPYLYHYAGRPDLTADRIHSILKQHYRTERDGLPDNEDMGCQSAFYMCSAMGLYPIMGQDIYLLSTPVFERTVIQMGSNGGFLTIIARNISSANRYVASCTLNGAALNRAWIRHGEIAGGAELILELCPEPSNWGADDLPPTPMKECNE